MLWACCLIVLLVQLLRAQEPTGVQFKVQSRLVLVDLVVTDGTGNFVPDLRADEMQVFEDGKQRPVSFFEKKELRVAASIERLFAPGASAIEVPDRASLSSARTGTGVTLVFAIDLPTIPGKLLPQVKKAIEDFVRSKVGPSDSLMLVAAGQGMRVYQPPIRDVAVFLESLSRVGATEEPNSLLRFGEELDAVLRSARNMDLPPDWVTRNAYNLGREHIQREEQLAQASFDSTIALVKEIGTLAGRKNIVFYSAGHRLKIGAAIQEAIQEALKEAPSSGRGGRTAPSGSAPPAASDSSSLQIRSLLGTMTSMEKLDSFLRRLIDEANRAQVSFYAIDARALMTEQDIRIHGTSPYSERLMREEIAQPQDFLRALAAETGGRSFLYTNDLGMGISSAYLDLARYYELGYVPAGEPNPGALHRITLTVLRPGLHVSYRHAFVEPDPSDAERRIVENAFKFSHLYSDFPIEADAGQRNGKLRVDVFIPARFLTFGRSGDRYRCDLTVYMALFDSSGKLYGDSIWFTKTYGLDYGEAERERLKKVDNLTSSCQGTMPPGNYRLKVVVRQSPASRTAALEKLITVP